MSRRDGMEFQSGQSHRESPAGRLTLRRQVWGHGYVEGEWIESARSCRFILVMRARARHTSGAMADKRLCGENVHETMEFLAARVGWVGAASVLFCVGVRTEQMARADGRSRRRRVFRSKGVRGAQARHITFVHQQLPTYPSVRLSSLPARRRLARGLEGRVLLR